MGLISFLRDGTNPTELIVPDSVQGIGMNNLSEDISMIWDCFAHSISFFNQTSNSLISPSIKSSQTNFIFQHYPLFAKCPVDCLRSTTKESITSFAAISMKPCIFFVVPWIVPRTSLERTYRWEQAQDLGFPSYLPTWAVLRLWIWLPYLPTTCLISTIALLLCPRTSHQLLYLKCQVWLLSFSSTWHCPSIWLGCATTKRWCCQKL